MLSSQKETMKNEQIVSRKKKLHEHRSQSLIHPQNNKGVDLTEVLLLSSFPPRECGIATYTQDLVNSLQTKFKQSYRFSICPLETNVEHPTYAIKPKYVLNTDEAASYKTLAIQVNENKDISIVFLQHEFGFFRGMEKNLLTLLEKLKKEIVITFHTVLPNPNEDLKKHVQQLAKRCKSIIVMTNTSADILTTEYGIKTRKITMIPHGTHLLAAVDKQQLKKKYNLTNKKVLSTFGLLSSGKNIETTLAALPAIVEKNPDVLFLIIGKTHPSVVKQEGEAYRESLTTKVKELHLEGHVRFVNQYLPLAELLEYLQLTDIYLFTSKDRNQAVSGTFSYAISCGCPVISTPIPHAREVLDNNTGIIIDFEAPTQLALEVNKLFANKTKLGNLSLNGLHKMASTAWENSAIAHVKLFEKFGYDKYNLRYELPPINLDHILKMTTDFGMIQFAKINKPDRSSGYTLDDNARAMIALCQYYQLTKDNSVLEMIHSYLSFIEFCVQPNGKFLNYVDQYKAFTKQNQETNLEDANGRAIWALGNLIATPGISFEWTERAQQLLLKVLPEAKKMYSTRAMAFTIKGLCLLEEKENNPVIEELANRLVQMYLHEADENWKWPEPYLTYGNSVLPEALLYAWQATGNMAFFRTAKESFDFLLTKIFTSHSIHVISNKGWAHKGGTLENPVGGQQPIDVAYTILALDTFYTAFGTESYKKKLRIAFNWFLGENQLNQIIYNPSTGGCYDGLEEHTVNLNQGAESTISYFIARVIIAKEPYKN